MNTAISAHSSHLEGVLRHIENVRSNCTLLGSRLIASGEESLGINLIGLGLIHDASKILNQVEFQYLRQEFYGTELFTAAHTSHVTTNLHHPEAWHGIEEMPRLYVAEMACDWKSRSAEFGQNILEWVKKEASKKYKFSTSGRVYKEIKEFLEILCDRAF